MKMLDSRICCLMVGLGLSLFTAACSSPKTAETNPSPNPETAPTQTNTAETGEVAVAPSPYQIDFGTTTPNATFKGFNDMEGWGRWTEESVASITYNQSLPSDFVVVLNAKAYANNVNQDLTLTIGSQTQKFRLGSEPQEVKLEFKGIPPEQRELTFGIPAPTSPKELNQGDDPRKLGIGFEILKIEKLN